MSAPLAADVRRSSTLRRFDDEVPSEQALGVRSRPLQTARKLFVEQLSLQDFDALESLEQGLDAALRINLDERPRLVRRSLDRTRHDLSDREMFEQAILHAQFPYQLPPVMKRA